MEEPSEQVELINHKTEHIQRSFILKMNQITKNKHIEEKSNTMLLELMKQMATETSKGPSLWVVVEIGIHKTNIKFSINSKLISTAIDMRYA